MKTKILTLVFLLAGIWAQSQTDTTLTHYIKLALENNPQVKAAYEEYRSSAEQIRINRALPDPTVSFAYAISPVQTRLGPQVAKLSLMQMFPWFGTLSEKEKIAASRAKSKYDLFVQKANQVAYDVSKVYWDMFFFQKELKIISEQINLLKSLERQSASRLETSETSAVDLLTFQMAIDELSVMKDNATRELQQRREQLLTLLSADSLNQIVLPDTAQIALFDILPLDSLLNRNALISARKNSIEAAQYGITLANRITKPSFGAGIDYAFIGGGQDALMPMLTVSLPIRFGKNKAIKRQADFNLQQSKQTYYATIDLIEIQYDKWKKDYENEIRNLKLYNRLIDKANQALQILYAGYSTGNADYLKTITMENNLLKYEIGRLRALSNIKILEAQYNLLLSNFSH